MSRVIIALNRVLYTTKLCLKYALQLQKKPLLRILAFWEPSLPILVRFHITSFFKIVKESFSLLFYSQWQKKNHEVNIVYKRYEDDMGRTKSSPFPSHVLYQVIAVHNMNNSAPVQREPEADKPSNDNDNVALLRRRLTRKEDIMRQFFAFAKATMRTALQGSSDLPVHEMHLQQFIRQQWQHVRAQTLTEWQVITQIDRVVRAITRSKGTESLIPPFAELIRRRWDEKAKKEAEIREKMNFPASRKMLTIKMLKKLKEFGMDETVNESLLFTVEEAVKQLLTRTLKEFISAKNHRVSSMLNEPTSDKEMILRMLEKERHAEDLALRQAAANRTRAGKGLTFQACAPKEQKREVARKRQRDYLHGIVAKHTEIIQKKGANGPAKKLAPLPPLPPLPKRNVLQILPHDGDENDDGGPADTMSHPVVLSDAMHVVGQDKLLSRSTLYYTWMSRPGASI